MDKREMETVVKLCGAVDPSLMKSANQAQKALGGINLKAAGMKVAFAGAAILAVKAITDISKGLFDLGVNFDKAYDSIRIGTGATGKQLEALKGDFKSVYSSVPTSMEDASKAIADYNTRLGLTGQSLQDLSKQAIAVSGMLGEDLSSTIESSSKAFQQWGISANNMGHEMDFVFKVSQSTGMGFNQLMESMKSVGPQMQQLGFTFEQSASMMGQMEKAGLNTDEVLKAMKKSVGVFAKDGLNAADGMKTYYEAIQNATSETKAITLASEVFGQRAGSTMASAIRSGALSIDAFTQSLQNSDESIMKAMWDTADAQEKMQMLGQRFQVLIEPLASGLFDAINDLMPMVFDIFNQLQPYIEQTVAALLPVVQQILPLLGDTLIELMPTYAQIALSILPAVAQILSDLTPLIVALANGINIVLSAAIKAVIPLFNDIIATLSNVIQFVINVFTLQWKTAWTNLVEIVKNVFKGLLDIVLAPFKAIGNAINNVKNMASGNNNKNNSGKIPTFATGGFTNGISIAGEAGREAIISFDPAYRSDNISTWLKAGQMLGVSSGSSSNSYNLGGFTFSPQILIKESMNGDEIVSKLKSAEGEFVDMIEDYLERKTLGSYSSASMSY